MTEKISRVWATLRVLVGLVFFWAFIDKFFGLGRWLALGTPVEKSLISGASVTAGYLGSSHGPLAALFKPMAGLGIVEFLFMFGLFAVGLALILGAPIKLGSWGGIVMMALMWLSHFPPTHHPFVDDHLVYAVVLYGFTLVGAGDVWGIGAWWRSTSLVKKYPWLA